MRVCEVTDLSRSRWKHQTGSGQRSEGLSLSPNMTCCPGCQRTLPAENPQKLWGILFYYFLPGTHIRHVPELEMEKSLIIYREARCACLLLHLWACCRMQKLAFFPPHPFWGCKLHFQASSMLLRIIPYARVLQHRKIKHFSVCLVPFMDHVLC